MLCWIVSRSHTFKLARCTQAPIQSSTNLRGYVLYGAARTKWNIASREKQQNKKKKKQTLSVFLLIMGLAYKLYDSFGDGGASSVVGDDDNGGDSRHKRHRATSTTMMMILLFLLFFFFAIIYYCVAVGFAFTAMRRSRWVLSTETCARQTMSNTFMIVVALHIQFRYRAKLK